MGSTLKAKESPMLLARSCPPMATASNSTCSAKPSATPISTCCAVTMRPATENGVMPSGGGTIGATRRATAAASTMRTRAGTKIAPNAGATMKQAPMRTNGQKTCPSQLSSCVPVTLITSVDECRNALVELARVADDELQHPGAGDDERECHRHELRNERERHLVDLCRRLEGADHESRQERHEQERRGEHQRHFERALSEGHHGFRGHEARSFRRRCRSSMPACP